MKTTIFILLINLILFCKLFIINIVLKFITSLNLNIFLIVQICVNILINFITL